MDCPQCGNLSGAGANFCSQCGANLTLAANQPNPTSDHFRHSPIQSRASAAVPSERKYATVLFADISRSTALVAGRDPEEARQILSPYVQLMIEAVHLYGGTVSRVLGDGVMALFGAPNYDEDHAVNACYAAMHMHECVAHPVKPRESVYADLPVQIHIGISSGDVLVGTVASDLYADYDASGEAIHLGARLQNLAEAGTTICSASTVRLAQGFVRTRSCGPTVIRGFPIPDEPHELLGARHASTRFRATATRRALTTFVGREAEFARLREALERAQDGTGQVVCLAGEAGVGKSRLIWEFVHSEHTSGWQVFETSAFSYRTSTPYYPVLALLRSYFGLLEDGSANIIRHRISQKLKGLEGVPSEFVTAVWFFLGLPVDDPAFTALDPEQRRDVFIDGFKRILIHESRISPLIIVIEDLHWADSATHALIENLVDALRGSRVVMLLSSRDGVNNSCCQDGRCSHIQVAPLSEADAGALVSGLLGQYSYPGTLRARLIERAEGNPLFLEEIINVLRDGDVAGSAQSGMDDIRMPESILALLGARIDELKPREKSILQAAATIGARFPLELVRRLHPGLEDDALQAGLAGLKAAGLIRDGSQYPEPEYLFVHGLYQEVAYDGILLGQRRDLHLRVLQALEEREGMGRAIDVETLALHGVRGQAWAQAAHYTRVAAERAANQSAYREAVRYYEQALEAIDHLPDDPDTIRDAIDIRFALRNSLFPLGMIRTDLGHVTRAKALADQLGDAKRSAWSSAFMARDRSLLDEQEQALEDAKGAVGLAVSVQDRELELLANAYIAQAHYALGDYRQSADVLHVSSDRMGDDSLDLRLGLPGPAVLFFRAWLIWALARLGSFKDASTQCEKLIAISDRAEQPLSVAVARYTKGFLLCNCSHFEDAIAPLEQSMELCDNWGFSAWITNVAATLGYAYALTGRYDDGRRLLERAVEKDHSSEIMTNHANWVAWLADAHFSAERYEDAETVAQSAIALAREQNEFGNEATALTVLGDVLMARGDSALVLLRHLRPMSMAAWAARVVFRKHGCDVPSHRCQRIWDVALRPQWGCLWV